MQEAIRVNNLSLHQVKLLFKNTLKKIIKPQNLRKRAQVNINNLVTRYSALRKEYRKALKTLSSALAEIIILNKRIELKDKQLNEWTRKYHRRNYSNYNIKRKKND